MSLSKPNLYDTSLPTIVIDEGDKFRNYEQIGFGGEGAVYRYDEHTVFKTFDFTKDQSLINHKFQKIELLGSLRDSSICYPTGLVGFKSEFKEGYLMDYVEKHPEYGTFFNLKYLKDVRTFLEVVRKADGALKRAHESGVAFGDLRADNILVDKEFNPHFVDVDNCFYGGLEPEVPDPKTVHALMDRYDKAFSPYDNDKYLLTVMFLQYFLSTTIISLHSTDRFFKKLIEVVDVEPEVRDALRIILSDSEDKPYLGEFLNKIDPQVPLFDREAERELSKSYLLF